MLKSISLRLLWLIPMLLGVAIFTFGLLQFVPGDPITETFGLDVENMDDSQIERLRYELSLNDLLPVQYLHYLERLLQGDFGRSISPADRADQPQEILEVLPAIGEHDRRHVPDPPGGQRRVELDAGSGAIPGALVAGGGPGGHAGGRRRPAGGRHGHRAGSPAGAR